MSRASDNLVGFFNGLLYLFAFVFFLVGLAALAESESVAGLLCFVVGLLICLLISLAKIRRTLRGKSSQ